MFPTFVKYPKAYRYEGQDEDEQIILLLRAHPITTLSWIIPAVLLFLIPFYLPSLINFINFDLSFIPDQYMLIFMVFNYLLVLIILFEGFLGWYFNVNIVTDRRIVDIDFHSILFRNIDIAPLTNVEEANSDMGGVIRAIFNFGHVHIQTAGSRQTIDFHNVVDPHRVADIILDESHKIHKKGQ